MTDKTEPAATPGAVTNHPLVQAAFADPRFLHMRNLGDLEDPEPEQVGYDRVLTLQALVATYTLRSAEKQAKTLARATWALVLATVGLVIATVALIFAGS